MVGNIPMAGLRKTMSQGGTGGLPPTMEYFKKSASGSMTPKPPISTTTLYGPPQQIADTLKRVEAIGIEEVILYFNSATAPTPLCATRCTDSWTRLRPSSAAPAARRRRRPSSRRLVRPPASRGPAGKCQGKRKITFKISEDQLALARRACSIAAHTRAGVAGMSMWVTPSGASASSTALIAAQGAATVPASPAPLTPSALVRVGMSSSHVSIFGRSSARGRL